MITLTQGEPLKQDDVDAIVNAVNSVGVMGKGIALQFEHRWPANFTEYAAACKAGKVRPGRMFIHMLDRLVQPQYIIIFPTKEHWRERSRPQFIEEGLVDLVTQVQCLGIHSIAIPPLGCGNGGLDWPDVRPLIRGAFERLPEVEVSVLAFWATAALRHRYRKLRTGSFLPVRIRASPLTGIPQLRLSHTGVTDRLEKNAMHKPEDIAAQFLGKGFDQLDARAQKVVHHMAGHRHISRNTAVPGEDQADPSAGQKAADAVAAFGGSWTFVGLFAAVMLVWVGLNAWLLAQRGSTFDPYPFILLNLFLSMLAAIQAPVILMSQNRQAQKDRYSAEHDYEVNLKAELEIMLLHDKLDALRETQWAALVETQKEQLAALATLLAHARQKP